MEIPRHVGDYKEFLLMPIGKERRKGKAQSYKKKKNPHTSTLKLLSIWDSIQNY